MATSEKYSRMETRHNVLVKNAKNSQSFWRKIALLAFFVLFVVSVILFCGFMYSSKFHCADHDDRGIHEKITIQAETDEDDGRKAHFLWFSDIHMDNYYKPSASSDWSKSYCRNASMPSSYDAPFGRIGCDSPRSLLSNALYIMRNTASGRMKPKFIVFTGDASAHNLEGNLDHLTRRERVLKAMETSTEEIKIAFPATPYFPSLGNNDLPGHYVLPKEGDSWYQDVLDIWEHQILCESCGLEQPTTTRNALRETFLKGGYYKVNLPGTKMVLLVLNSMLWANKAWTGSQFLVDTANEQMQWVKSQLQSAKEEGRRVLIQAHMPPGTDTFEEPYPQVWLKNYTEMYRNIATTGYSDVIAAHLYAHYHTDEYRLLRSPSDLEGDHLSPMLLSASISPCYNNNPNFRIVQLNKKYQAIQDYMQYYIELVVTTQFDTPIWQLDYKFSERHPPSGEDDQMINGKRISRFNEEIINIHNNKAWIQYFASHTVHHQPSNDISKFVLYCAMKHIGEEDFKKCHEKYKVPGA